MKATGPPDGSLEGTVAAVRSLRRWLVLGAGGGGKSRLSGELAGILGLPVIHLDRHYWRPGWVEPPGTSGADA